MSPMTPISPGLQKECPICMCFMTEPVRLPGEPCDHHICIKCIEGWFKKGSTEVFTFDEKQERVCAKCPICRVYSFANLDEGLNFIKVDEQYRNLL